MAKHHMECCTCGLYAGHFEQWHNRDEDYGICERCAGEEAAKLSPERMKSLYGIAGVHYHGHAPEIQKLANEVAEIIEKTDPQTLDKWERETGV